MAQDSLDSLSKRMTGSGRVHLRVATPSDKFTNELRVVPGVRAILTSQPGLYEIETDGEKGIAQKLAAHAVSSGAGLLELREETFNLEDIFLKLTTSEESQGAVS